MPSVQQSPSALAYAGMLAGSLFLGFAGVLLVTSPSSLIAIEKEAASAVSPGSRQLQTMVVDSNGNLVTFTKAPSSFQELEMSIPSSGESFMSSEQSSSAPFKSAGSLSVGDTLGQSETWLFGIFSTVGHLSLMLLFAMCYHHSVVVPIIQTRGIGLHASQYTGKDDFDTGICECMDPPVQYPPVRRQGRDVWVLIHGFCCPLVRMAHTNAVSGIMGYWESALCWCCCYALTGGLGQCCLMVYWRKRLKDIMGIEDHLVNDMCISCCCWPLSVIQQGIAVDDASGYRVTGCCNLEWAPGQHQALAHGHFDPMHADQLFKPVHMAPHF